MRQTLLTNGKKSKALGLILFPSNLKKIIVLCSIASKYYLKVPSNKIRKTDNKLIRAEKLSRVTKLREGVCLIIN